MRNSDKLVSIIIPAYNAEKTIEECLRRVSAQTYMNIEIIVIDDGSTDKTSSIVKSFIQRDPRVKLLVQKNGGVGKARNTGIENAAGEFITFCDADDYPTKRWVEVLCAGMSDFVDLSICTYQRCVSVSEIIENPEIQEPEIMERNRIWWLYRLLLLNSNCNKLYRNNRILDGKIRFGNAQNGEDLEFNLDYLSVMEGKISFVSTSVYVYIDNPESVTHNYIPNKWNETVHRMKKLKDVMVEFNVFTPDVNNDYYHFYLSRIETCISNCMLEDSFLTRKIRNVNHIVDSKECQKVLNEIPENELSHLGKLIKLLRPLHLFGFSFCCRYGLIK